MENKCYDCGGEVYNSIDGKICCSCGFLQDDDLKEKAKNRRHRNARLRKLNSENKPKTK